MPSLMITNIIFMTFMCRKILFFFCYYTHMGHVVFVALLFPVFPPLLPRRYEEIPISLEVPHHAKFTLYVFSNANVR